MQRSPRAIVIVLDSVGVGELPDADLYGDAGSNTLGNTARACGGLRLPVLGALGLGNITEVLGVPPIPRPRAAWGRSALRSAGKDTTTGHWEMMGVTVTKPFPTYPHGFPSDVIERFCALAGVPGVLGNRAASGTMIINELGDENLRTGLPIVYTSADSVFQVAAHEETFGLERLYHICELARGMLTGNHGVGRVIARPFLGPDLCGAYWRTEHRRDYALEPFGPTVLDLLTKQGIPVFGIGKIGDIFAGRGVTSCAHTRDNNEGFLALLAAVQQAEAGFVFCNLVDFDMLWGHRNDIHGYAAGLEAFDQRLPELLGTLLKEDLLIITADHGCDPTTSSTDHSREYVPVLAAFGSSVSSQCDALWAADRQGAGEQSMRANQGCLGTRTTLADVGATVLDFYEIAAVDERAGTSFLKRLSV